MTCPNCYPFTHTLSERISLQVQAIRRNHKFPSRPWCPAYEVDLPSLARNRFAESPGSTGRIQPIRSRSFKLASLDFSFNGMWCGRPVRDLPFGSTGEDARLTLYAPCNSRTTTSAALRPAPVLPSDSVTRSISLTIAVLARLFEYNFQTAPAIRSGRAWC